MIEGAVLDWSAVFLSSHHGMATEYAGLGYAAFACTMTVGRLTGDRIVQRLGGFKVVLLGGICAALGVAATLVPLWPVAMIGYALVGAGCSNIVPVMFSAVGRQTVMPENVAVRRSSLLAMLASWLVPLLLASFPTCHPSPSRF
jgi:MFS family permease